MSDPRVVDVVVPAGTVVVIVQPTVTQVTEEEFRKWERPAPDSDSMYGGKGGGHSYRKEVRYVGVTPRLRRNGTSQIGGRVFDLKSPDQMLTR